MYKLKDVAVRATAFAGAVFMLGGVMTAALPGIVSADALNPLTERTLMISSSSPGWAFTDGSNNGTYAPPGSGPNGQKTSETFSFRNSTNNGVVKGFSFQYCTAPAGNCIAPGNVGSSDPQDPVEKQSALDVNYTTPTEGTDFEVRYGETYSSATASTGWAMTTAREVSSAGFNPSGDNMIYLTNTSGNLTVPTGTKIWVVFKASATNYITNPGRGAFFVKLNTYTTATVGTMLPTTEANVIDGGVTVANVMNESIHITTKVLETMAFSVGTENPDTVAGVHGPCDMIEENNELKIGDANAEDSLDFDEAFDAYSFWRLSTNSSAGATVYYSGQTLNNTVGDDINEMGTDVGNGGVLSNPGTEQFGLAIDPSTYPLDGGADPQVLTPLVAQTGYALGNGSINVSPAARFSFLESSNTSPVPIALNTSGVLECSTARMRYVANIAPFTPAGVYTTKINYIAAPRY